MNDLQPQTATSEDAESRPSDPEEAAMEASRMSLFDHLNELRYRLRNAFIAFFIALGIGFVFKERIFEVLTRPIREALKESKQPIRIVQLEVGEAFWVYFKLAIAVGMIISAPFVLWEIWKFVAPGLYRKEKRLALTVVAATGLCFTVGAVFGYFLLIKPAVFFLVSWAGEMPVPEGVDPFPIETMLSMQSVASFEVMMLLGCGVAFELPVVLSVMGALGIVSSGALWRFNKYALILSALLGGLLTPGGDVVSQLLLAGPIFALYNVSILIIKGIERTRAREAAALDSGTAS